MRENKHNRRIEHQIDLFEMHFMRTRKELLFHMYTFLLVRDTHRTLSSESPLSNWCPRLQRIFYIQEAYNLSFIKLATSISLWFFKL